jgi:hypothetical protein
LKTCPPPFQPRPKESFVSQTLNAFDFAAVRSKRDAELLYEAKYGERGADGKMTQEQYQALRRKIGGTSRDFFKSWVEEEQVKNIKVSKGMLMSIVVADCSRLHTLLNL